MFKKKFKISTHHSLSSKDKKKLKEAMTKFQYEPSSLEQFFDDSNYDDEQLVIEKIQGQRSIIYSRAKIPLIYASDSKPGSILLPSLYVLFKQPELPIVKILMKEGVERFIFNGADLMFPGIKAIFPS
jgi:predicted ribosome-associated RNA-binding protein Tma20